MKKLIIIILTFLCFPLIIYYSENITTGIISGIKICVNTIIPSLYLLTVLSVFVVKAHLFSELKLIKYVSNKIFRLSGNSGSVLLLSLLCGYPVGAKLVDELYTNKEIDKKSAELLICFCVNPGPAFVITTVGFCLYNSYYIGLILFVSMMFSPLIYAFLNRKSFNSYEKPTHENINYTSCFCDAVNIANKSMATICGWVIIGSALINVLKNYDVVNKLCCVLEVSSGVIIAADISIYLVAFLIGFGGISVHLQAMSGARNIKPRYSIIFLWKVAQGITSVVIVYILLKVFPQGTQTINLNGLNVENSGVTPLASIMLMLFLITSLTFLQRRLKNYGKRQ